MLSHENEETASLNVVKYLLSQNANLEEKSSFGWNALHFAAHSRNLKVVKYLVEDIKMSKFVF
jgi:ankyrin repeat protein